MKSNLRNKGYTLIEVGISLIILALISLGIIGTMNYAQTVRTRAETLDNFQSIEDALVSYLATNGRLPCPANPALIEDDEEFGYEATITSDGFLDCDQDQLLNNIGVTGESKSIYMGMIPVSTLGMEPDFAFDGYGNRISYVVDRAFANSGIETENNLGITATNPLCESTGDPINDPTTAEFQCFAKQLTGDVEGVIDTQGSPDENIYSSVSAQCRVFGSQSEYTRENYCNRYCGSSCSEYGYTDSCYSEICDNYCNSRCDTIFKTDPKSLLGLIVENELVPNESNTCDDLLGNPETNFYSYTMSNYCTDCTKYCTYADFDRETDGVDADCRNDVCEDYCKSKCYDVINKGDDIIPNFYFNNGNVRSIESAYNKCRKGDHDLDNYTYKIYCTNACENYNLTGTYQNNKKLSGGKTLNKSCFSPFCNSFCNSMIVGNADSIHEEITVSSSCAFIGFDGTLQTTIDPALYCKPECYSYDPSETFFSNNTTWGTCFDAYCRDYCALYKEGELSGVDYGSHGDTRYYPADDDIIFNKIITPFTSENVDIYNRLCASVTPFTETYESYCGGECEYFCENSGEYITNDGCHSGICDEYCTNICQDLADDIEEDGPAKSIEIYSNSESGGALITNEAVYVLISHGQNGYGAFVRAADDSSGGGSGPVSERLGFDGASDDEKENLDCEDGGCGGEKINGKFVDRLLSDDFDDIVYYDTRYGMIVKCNKLSSNVCTSSTGHHMLLP